MAVDLDSPLRRDRLFEQVAHRIQNMIVAEHLRPGDRLPSERDLAESLNVSRSVIREAVRVLAVRGLVEVRSGSGTYIKEPKLSDASAPIGLFLKLGQSPSGIDNLCEVRCTLEVAIAGLAAERATEEDIAAMEAAIDNMTNHAGDAEQFTFHDLSFHMALAAATQNDLYRVLLQPISDLLLDFRITAYGYDAQSTIDNGLIYHRKLLSLIEERDAEGAREAMRKHLDQAESLLRAAFEQVGVS
jgi:GntR family transcriptional repressor for pyruvate dehydrogenase complex